MKDKLNIISQERSVLEDVVLDQLWSLKEGGPLGLMKPHKPSNKQLEELREEFPYCADTQVASEWRSPATGQRYWNGDVVDTSSRLVGQIKYFVCSGGAPVARVAVWRQREWTSETLTGIYDTREARVQHIPCHDLRSALIYSAAGLDRTVIWSL